MDPKKKKIYIIIIVVCFSATAAILGWSLFGSKAAAPPPQGGPANPINFDPSVLQGGTFVGTGYDSPVVFPGNSNFKTSVLKSSEFSKLKPYTPVDVSGQTGRPDPFQSY